MPHTVYTGAMFGKRKARMILGVAALMAALPCGADTAASADPLAHFENTVAPVLQERCLSCHGADQRKGGLRLHLREAVDAGGASGVPTLAAGNPEGSELFRRIASANPDDRMPPKGAPLNAGQVEAIRQWIADGAVWDDAVMARPFRLGQSHWAFKSPRQAAPPEDPSGWSRNSIDQFLLARMREAGLYPSPEADRHTLIRRLSLDLTGLPPTPEEIQAFVTDNRPDAYERAVERLLESPHYGEPMAIRWLDLARYADTNGYEKDRHRSAWPYRDWVIDAFNRDLPYDQFMVEQLAGDLLPDATPEQRIATGFLRNSLYNEEGGVDVEEFRYEAMVDRVSTTATAFLGLTLSCAQCHDHKYDPISHQEYFSFFAFLNNTENALLEVHDAGVEEARREKQAQIVEALSGLESKFTPRPEGTEAELPPGEHLAQRLRAWLDETRKEARDWDLLDPVDYASAKTATLNRLDDRSILVTGECPNIDTYTVTFRLEQEGVSALRLEALPHASLPGEGPGRGMIMSPDGDFFLSEVRVYAAPWGNPERRSLVPLGTPVASFSAEGRDIALAADGKVDTGWGINGRQGEAHQAVFPLAQPLPSYPGGTLMTVELEHFYVHQHTLGRFRISAATGAAPANATGLPDAAERLLLKEEASLTPAEQEELKQHFLRTAPELAKEHEQIAAMRRAMPRHPTALVLEERATPRETRLHHRGEFLHPREIVSPATPAALHPFPETWPRNRLSFAQWLAHSENPLLARVAVNRFWQQVFGYGLVETTEDFGLMGSPPSHPELLDWLAVEFQRRGHRVKDLMRLIVTSSAYRQDSAVAPRMLEIDPQNRLLARAPGVRLDAELIRDVALTASGLMNPALGGPSVFPPIPGDVFEFAYTQGQDVWPTEKGDNRFRRGVYTYVKRLIPYPSASMFDMPARDVACTRRAQSNTPLQALTLLNDTEFFEAARAMGARVLREGGGQDESRLRLAFLLALGRGPDAVESGALMEFLTTHKARFASGEADPLPHVQGYEIEGISSAEQAAWAALCRVLLNLDETVSRT
ncbi:MAG: hypothetical protein RLZZ303_3334 [Candidatus Hydrogenedentota bacterium]